jgi:hypothetical protein
MTTSSLVLAGQRGMQVHWTDPCTHILFRPDSKEPCWFGFWVIKIPESRENCLDAIVLDIIDWRLKALKKDDILPDIIECEVGLLPRQSADDAQTKTIVEDPTPLDLKYVSTWHTFTIKPSEWLTDGSGTPPPLSLTTTLPEPAQTSTTDNPNKPATIENESNESKPDMNTNTPEKYSVSLAGSNLTASNLPSIVVDVSVRLMCGTSVTSAPFLATSQGGILITNGSLLIDDVFRKMNLIPGQYDGKQFDLVVTPMTSDASTIEETRILVQGDELVKLLAPTADTSTPPINDPAPPQPAPKPAPTLPPPAPEKSPEEKMLDAQRSRLELLKEDLNPDLPNGKKLAEQEWPWLSNAYGTTKSILHILQNSKFANSEPTQKLITETAELQKEINRVRISKWGKWPELKALLNNLNLRIHTLGYEEGQPGFAFKGELEQIEDSVDGKHWDSLEVGALFKALGAAEILRLKVVKAEDEAIAQSTQVAQEAEQLRAENKRQTEENEKLRNDAAKRADEHARLLVELEEARKKAVQPPSPNTPPAPKPVVHKAPVIPSQTPVKGVFNNQMLVIVLLIAVVLLIVMNIMNLLADRKWTSDTVPGGTVASMPPMSMTHQPALLADPRAPAFFEAFARAGMVQAEMVGVTNSSWDSNHTMNGTNYIGGHNLVNGSFMINYTLPPTNQPIIIVTNVTVTATNAAAVPQLKNDTTTNACPKHAVSKHADGCTSCWLCGNTSITTLQMSSDQYARPGDVTDTVEHVEPGEIVEINIAHGLKVCFGLSTISSFEVYVDVDGKYTLWTPTLESPLSKKHITQARVRLKPSIEHSENLYLRGLCTSM